MQLELVKTLDAAHWREHRYLDIDITQLLAAQRRETRIIEGCSSGHLRDDLIERHIFSEMSNAATQMAVFMQ